jgi:hypothetical protein
MSRETGEAHTPETLTLPLHADGRDVYEADMSPLFSVNGPNEAEIAAYIVKAVNSHAALVEALRKMTDRYAYLVNSGDAGNWNPETEPEVIAARALLRSAGEEP